MRQAVALLLGTQKDNIQDAVSKNRMASGDRNGSRVHPESLKRGDENGSRLHPELLKRGSENPASKLTEAKVIELLQTYGTNHDLARKFGISSVMVGLIRKGKKWKHIPRTEVMTHSPRTRTQLTEDVVREIIVAIGSQQDIASKFGIAQTTVSAIKRGIVWTHIPRPA
jgi:DNA invertase Pin-like site-specific DNA recombinase